MRDKRLYNDLEDFSGVAYGRQVVKEIRFSKDPRDFGYMAKNVPCQDACPVKTNIPGYIRCIYEGRQGRAYDLNRMYNIIPAVLGRICSRPCEAHCRHGEADLGSSVGICHLKRAAADHKVAGHRIKENLFSPSGKTVAVIGAGPAGLAAAHELTTLGHQVALYEAQNRPGGMLTYGIPEFRLPRDLLSLEIDNILRLGVDLHLGVAIGRDMSLKDLLKQHDAVMIATGCMAAKRLGVPGEDDDLEGYYSGLDFMMRANRGEKLNVGRKVAVVGAGFTAMDCSRMAVRFGAREVTVYIRKTEEYMVVDELERKEAKYERVEFVPLVSTSEIHSEQGRVTAISFRRNRLTFGPSGKGRIPVPIENSEFTLPIDTVISAVGQEPVSDFNDAGFKLRGLDIWTRSGTYRTNVDRLYAAGDCMTGSSTVIAAIHHGRQAAHEVDARFSGRRRKAMMVRFETVGQTDRPRKFDFIPPVEMPSIKGKERLADIRKEVETGYSGDEAHEESKRCYLCHLKYEIDIDRCIYCSACIDVAPRDCIKMIDHVEMKKDGSYGALAETRDWSAVKAISIDNERCIRCGACLDICPTKCISVTKVELVEQDLEA